MKNDQADFINNSIGLWEIEIISMKYLTNYFTKEKVRELEVRVEEVI
jgi:hypothetical protein